MRWLLRNPKYSVPATLTVLAGLAWLAFGVFGVHLLVVDDAVDDAPPVFAVADAPPTTLGTPILPAAAPAPIATAPVATTPDATVMPDSTATPSTATPTTTAPPTTTPQPTTTAQPTVVTEHSGSFVSRNHPTSGNAIVLGNGTGQRFLRFEQFETDNGPDLNVYLVNSSADGVSDVVDLGNLRGNIGDQNYEIPEGVDLDVYDTVLIWCVRFSSAFGEATLTAA